MGLGYFFLGAIFSFFIYFLILNNSDKVFLFFLGLRVKERSDEVEELKKEINKKLGKNDSFKKSVNKIMRSK